MGERTDRELLTLAAKADVPAWATHVAVRRDGSKVGPACWQERERAYLDEDPEALALGDWAGAYKAMYYRFFSIEQVHAAAIGSAIESGQERK